MEKLSSVSLDPSALQALRAKGVEAFPTEAVVQKALGSNRYLVLAKDGTSLVAIGTGSLMVGAKVKIAALPQEMTARNVEKQVPLSVPKGAQWSAKVPLQLGRRIVEAELEVYLEKEKKGLIEPKDPVIYLVFSVKTEAYGQVQWSVYLRRKQVLVQVYLEKGGTDNQGIRQMIEDFEDSMKKKGFSLLAPTVILKRPFRAPAGFQLNVRG